MRRDAGHRCSSAVSKGTPYMTSYEGVACYSVTTVRARVLTPVLRRTDACGFVRSSHRLRYEQRRDAEFQFSSVVPHRIPNFIFYTCGIFRWRPDARRRFNTTARGVPGLLEAAFPFWCRRDARRLFPNIASRHLDGNPLRFLDGRCRLGVVWPASCRVTSLAFPCLV